MRTYVPARESVRLKEDSAILHVQSRGRVALCILLGLKMTRLKTNPLIKSGFVKFTKKVQERLKSKRFLENIIWREP